MKVKNVVLGVCALLFAVITAFASLAPVTVAVRSNPSSTSPCTNIGSIDDSSCSTSGSFTCTMRVSQDDQHVDRAAYLAGTSCSTLLKGVSSNQLITTYQETEIP